MQMTSGRKRRIPSGLKTGILSALREIVPCESEQVTLPSSVTVLLRLTLVKMFTYVLKPLLISFTTLFILAEGVAIASIKSGNGLEENLTRNETSKVTKEDYEKCFSFMKHSRAFKNFTYQDAVNYIDEVMSYEIPDELVQRFPYYFSGYDYDGRPVWMAEMGKYKIFDLVETFEERFPVYEKIFAKAAIRIAQSMVASEREHPGKEIRQYTGLLDAEGFDLTVMYKILAHPEAILFGTKVGAFYLDLGVQAIGQAFIINVGYAAKMMTQIAAPVIGEIMERLVFLGTNKNKWKAVLRRSLPEQAIPSWYGGPENFKPLAVYG